ncbi:hypothetical protein PHET_03291 [Paragonimus heterotremus]|uniref:Peptidase M16 N-terminal domain-containing protein n=1 Tax=Paragonimus heterotremus TaxID=100268 RepID=A0A8J4WI15_9TREM|nr:hypothetical protein PHET_03291 [Paragonimus heterotremus]
MTAPRKYSSNEISIPRMFGRTVFAKKKSHLSCIIHLSHFHSENIFESCSLRETLASLAQPSVWPGLSRVAIVFKAGSRYELSGKDRGITHLIRRCCGLSTVDFTAVNMVRHFQQMGARVTCTTTREHMIYTVDVAPNFATRAGYLLARMATGTSYYEWELKSTAYKLMRKDIDLLNRRNLPALAMELLHQAAFGESSAGTGLGHSVFAPADRVGSHSFEQIESFHKHFFVPANCAISLVGHDPEADGLELLREIKAGLHVRAPQKVPEKTGKVHGFVGVPLTKDAGCLVDSNPEIRRSVCKANICMSAESAEFLATDLAVRASGPENMYEGPQQQIAAVDRVTVTQVNDAIKHAVSSPHCALSIVGPEASEILPLNVLI